LKFVNEKDADKSIEELKKLYIGKFENVRSRKSFFGIDSQILSNYSI
jgi:hypothetical protein